MKISCHQNLLLQGITTVLKACSTKTTMPILECILIRTNNNEVTLVGNNLELGIETTFPATILEEGSIALEAKIFYEIIKRMPEGDIEIASDKNKMTSIVCQNSRFNIAGQSGEDFPDLPEIQKINAFPISQLALKEMIRQTIFSVAQEDARPILTGEMLQIKDNALHLVAVDGYRISYRKMPLSIENESLEVVVPGRTLSEISKILSSEENEIVTLYFSDKHVFFDLGTTKVISRLLEGEFLKYEQIFSSDYETQVIVDKKNFLMSIERAALISREGKKNPIKIQISDDIMLITSNAELGTVREELVIELEGNEINIAFNPRYLIEALKCIEDDKICVRFISALTPCVIQPQESDHYKYLILPIRLNS
jgi:DNA polymerase-3 subunit beta